MKEIKYTKWLFEANEDWTETSIVPYTHKTSIDTNNKPFTFRHIFVAETFEDAVFQIEKLRYENTK